MALVTHGPVGEWAPHVRVLSVRGARIRVGVQGDGPPLLLLNGIGANLEMWESLGRRLPGRRIVMFDFPGTGASPPLRSPARMPELTRLVAGLLDGLSIDRADVLGYSWGGALAQELARRTPRRVRSLVLAATIPGLGGRPPAPWVLAAMGTPLRYYSPAYLRLVSPLVFGTGVEADEAHVRSRRARPPTLRGYAHQLYAISGWSSRLWLRELRVPTLVLAGDGDRVAPARNARILAAGIRGAELRSLPGGHLLLLREAEAAAAEITRFLQVQDRVPQEPYPTRSTT